MNARTLDERIESETGIAASEFQQDVHVLAGMFNQYRPDGAGLERLLSSEGIEGEVRARIQRVFDVTAPGCNPGDWYFVIRRPEPLDRSSAVRIAQTWLSSMKKLADFLQQPEAGEWIAALKVLPDAPVGGTVDEDGQGVLYDFLTDFLVQFGPEHHELFVLDEALYTMACDYFLVAYMLAPAIPLHSEAHGALDSYFDLWRYGIKLEFFEGGMVSVRLPE